MTEPTIIRASSLSGWADCPRRGAARAFRSEIEAAGFELRSPRRSIGAMVGTAVHRAAEYICDSIKSIGIPSESRARDAAHDALEEQFETGESVQYDGAAGPTNNRSDAERQVGSMTGAYHRVIAPQLRPVYIEQRFEAEMVLLGMIRSETELVLSGQPDIVTLEPGAVRDLKTGVRRPGNPAPQLGAYALLSRSLGLEIDQAHIDYIKRVSPDRPQPDPSTISLHVGHAEAAASSVLKHIAYSLHVWRHGSVWLDEKPGPGDPWAFIANPDSNLCSERWCPCYGITGPHSFCNEWRPKE